MRMNMLDWRSTLLADSHRAAVPIMTHPGIEMTGASIDSTVRSSEMQYRAVSKLASTYRTAAATMMMDLSAEAEAFGATVKFFEDETPSVTAGCVYDARSIRELRVPPLSAGRLPEYLKAASMASSTISDRPVFGCCIGPFSLAGRLYGMTEIMTAILIEPESIQLLLEKTTSFLLSYIQAFKQAGTNGLIIAEPASGMLSADLCEDFCSRYVKQIVSGVQDDNFMMILHNCGDTNTLLMTMQVTGAAGLHFGNKCDIVRALEVLDPKRIVMGNLDPVGVFRMGDPHSVAESTFSLLERTSGHPNFVISSGCDIPPGVPRENIEAFFNTIEKFNRSR